MFKSSLINTVEESNLMFNAIETQIIAEDARLHPFRHLESAMKASRAPKASTRPPNASTWCEHHLNHTQLHRLQVLSKVGHGVEEGRI